MATPRKQGQRSPAPATATTTPNAHQERPGPVGPAYPLVALYRRWLMAVDEHEREQTERARILRAVRFTQYRMRLYTVIETSNTNPEAVREFLSLAEELAADDAPRAPQAPRPRPFVVTNMPPDVATPRPSLLFVSQAVVCSWGASCGKEAIGQCAECGQMMCATHLHPHPDHEHDYCPECWISHEPHEE